MTMTLPSLPVRTLVDPGGRPYTRAAGRAAGSRPDTREVAHIRDDPPDPTTDPRAADARLLGRIRDRDERALEELYARYSGPLYSLACQVTGAERFAQEVVQDVFVAVWREAGRFDPARGSLGPWLYSLARHKAIDLVRREQTHRKRLADVDLELETAADDVDRDAWRNLRRQKVREAITRLPDAQRVAVEMAFFAGLTHVEVAARLEIPLGTAKTRIRVGLLRLRDVLGDSVSEAEASR
jgi:RNA polymerase sigma-70 factor, ECF subfamily